MPSHDINHIAILHTAIYILVFCKNIFTWKVQYLGLSTCRLDGSTPPKTRQSIVNNFNTGAATRVMLLSSKAGGTGLNLIGASRLVLYDIDWNPATDLQAMARIWRDGQRRPCHVVRVCLELE